MRGLSTAVVAGVLGGGLLWSGSAAAEVACTLVVEAADRTVLERSGSDCDTPTPPQSSFKLALALMGYDAGILQDANTPAIPYDPSKEAWRESWKRTTELRSPPGETGLLRYLLVASMAMPLGAHAVVLRDEADDAEYRVPASALPALADMPGEGHGVPVAPRWGVAAGPVRARTLRRNTLARHLPTE